MFLTFTTHVNLSGLERFQKAVENELTSKQEGPVSRALKQWAARYRSFIQERYDKYSKGGGDWKPLSRKTIAMRRDVAKKLSKSGKLNKKFSDTGKNKKGIVGPENKPREGNVNRSKGGKRGAKVRQLRGEIKRIATSPLSKKVRQKKIAKLSQRVAKIQSKSRGLSVKNTLSKKRRGHKAKVQAKRDRIIDKAKVSILRDTGLMFNALAPVFKGQPGALERTMPFGIRVGFGGNSRHPGQGVSIADIAKFHQTGGGNLPRREIIVDPSPEVVAAMAKDMDRALKKLGNEST